ncbi:RtcB family protein [Actinokineospora globicatena]|uniref:RtcB family protein n=1 Tax=Actinokineospora globicatena TaxID=103729 RepID=UPI0020A5E8B8|nr:RtcB family protein [Actinokineospora globicatena]MCP2301133.1 tRNA-splicing ligase RtcB [Actinokineospora globicatena]GLW77231.1 RNA-splicing ligase RtcB [Actinokineospora globicatena]GLW84065.1 RNA-splicing ligase RtcB [Actinokineospora globicatena]
MAATTIAGANVDIRLWADPEQVEDVALRQLRNIAALPWTYKHVAVMPDVHYGIGATVGSVIAMRGAVSPAAVGVDIGCGMTAVRTSLVANDLPESLAPLRTALEAAVPVGRAAHKSEAFTARDAADWGPFWKAFDELTPLVRRDSGKALKQMGTLGGGNHFIEVCLDESGQVWVMLHSGSRGIGNVLALHHIEVARGLAHNQSLPDRDLAVFIAGTPQMAAYRHDLYWAQDYARRNRSVMLRLVCDVLRRRFHGVRFDEPISAHHNYVAEETHFGEEVLVTRKGAIRARRGDMGIIPGSMGTGSYIVRGLGNPDSFESASHGAGRRMSRTKAKNSYTAEDLAAQTAGVECRKDSGVVDEIPAAYKNIDDVIRAQDDLVEVVAKLKQVICVKG